MWPFSPLYEAPRSRIEPNFRASLENPNVPINQDQLAVIVGGGPTMAGPVVSESSSIRSVEVFRCVSILSGLVAGLKMNVFKDLDGGRELAETHRLYPLFWVQPNQFMSSFVWRELMMVNLLLWGNHYSVIEYDNASRVVGFVPLAPWSVEPVRQKGGSLTYRVRLQDGSVEVVDQADMIHIPGMGFDGIRGLPVITAVGRQAIGTSLAMEEFTARLHSNGVRPSGIGKAKEGIAPAAFARLRQQFDNHYSGTSNAGKTLWVDAGTDWIQTQISPVDAETLASRRFSTAQICNIFGVPSMLLNENADMTAWGSGIEQIMLGFLVTTIKQWLERIEGEFNRKLFLGTKFEVEFDREGLIALDSKSKGDLYSKLIMNGMMTPNEARRRLNLPDDPSGNMLYIQGATVPISQAGIKPATTSTAAPGGPGASTQ